MGTAFGLAAPLGSAPDEPDHWRYAWGIVTGQDTSTLSVTVPRSLAGNHADCFNERPEISAACAAPIPKDKEKVRDLTSAYTYPTLYYRIVGWPLLFSNSTPGLLAVRILSAFVCAAFWGLAFAPWQARKSWLMRLALLSALTPSALYFAGVINPQGLEFASLAAAWSLSLFVMSELRSRSYRELPRWAQWSWPTVLAVASMARVLSWWFAVVVIVACWFAVRPSLRKLRHDRRGLLALGVVGFFIVERSAAFVVQFFGAKPLVHPGTDVSFLQISVNSLWRALNYPGNAIAQLGWLDTNVPSASSAIWFFLFGVVVALSATRVDSRHLVACATALTALLLTWAVLDPYLSNVAHIPFWQARYGLGLVIGVPILLASATTVEHRNVDPPRLVGLLVGWALLAGWILALGFLLVRYMWGVTFFGPIGSPAWDPYISPYLLVLATVAGGFLVVRSVATVDRRERLDVEQS